MVGLFLASTIASSPNNFSWLTAASGLVATIVAACTFFLATRANHQKESAASKAVDAGAYNRAVEIYESTIANLRSEISDLHVEISDCRTEIAQLRKSNTELATNIDKLRHDSYNELSKRIAKIRSETEEASHHNDMPT